MEIWCIDTSAAADHLDLRYCAARREIMDGYAGGD